MQVYEKSGAVRGKEKQGQNGGAEPCGRPVGEVTRCREQKPEVRKEAGKADLGEDHARQGTSRCKRLTWVHSRAQSSIFQDAKETYGAVAGPAARSHET